MTTWVFQPEPVTALAVADSEALFPVHRIYCVGRNYAEHAQEMGHSGREAPFFFMKPADALVQVPEHREGVINYPSRTENLHYEIELVAALSKGGRQLTVEQAADAIWGFAVGLDMTRRDLQSQAKDKGRPWDVAKGYDGSAPIGTLYPRSQVGTLERGLITLDVNGVRKQQGDLSDMLWSTAECLAELSTYFELKAGDLLMTGTPAGVGPVTVGDRLLGAIEGLGQLSLRIE